MKSNKKLLLDLKKTQKLLNTYRSKEDRLDFLKLF